VKTKKKIEARGGARAGSGRKKLGRVKLLISVLPVTAAQLRARARREGGSIGAIVDQLLLASSVAFLVPPKVPRGTLHTALHTSPDGEWRKTAESRGKPKPA
jgi:hypothetical protein